MTCSTDSIVLSDGDRDTMKRLRHIGRKLSKDFTYSIHQLLQLLDKLELVLSNLEHDPPKPIQGSLVLPMKTLISDQLLRHTDEDVKISTTACLTEIARITAPNAPYDDEQMKEFLKLAVAAFEKLSHESGRRYQKAISILEHFSNIKMYLIILDLECDDLVIEMFQHFLRIIRSNHPSNVIESMEKVMTGILDESEDISLDLLRPLLDIVRKENQTISPISWTLGEKVITNCAVKLKPYLMQAVVSSGRTLDTYPQIVISICQNQHESQEHNQSLIQAVENNFDVPKDAHEEPCDATKGLETVNTCVRDGQVQTASMDGSKRKLYSCTKNSEQTNPKTSTRNLELVQEMNSETQLDIVPRKRTRKPNSLMNHSWIVNSSQPKKARDNGYALALSKNPTSTKAKTLSKRKTVGQVLLSEVKSGRVSKKTSAKSRNDENTNADSLTNHNIRDGNCLKRRRPRNHDDRPNHVLKCHGVGMENISKVKQEAPVRTIKLSIKFDGKVVVPPTSIVASTKSDHFCKGGGRSSSQIEVNKRRRQTATSNKGFNKSSSMKGHEPIKLDNSLVGKRIKIWWPLDKIYYEGVVETFDHARGKHKILYDDGDMEQLNLNKERWELVDVSPEALGLHKLGEASHT